MLNIHILLSGKFEERCSRQAGQRTREGVRVGFSMLMFVGGWDCFSHDKSPMKASGSDADHGVISTGPFPVAAMPYGNAGPVELGTTPDYSQV